MIHVGMCLTDKGSGTFEVADGQWDSSNPHWGHKIMWRNGEPASAAMTAPQIVEPIAPIAVPTVIVEPASPAPIVDKAAQFTADVASARAAMSEVGNIIFEREELIKQLMCALIAQQSMIIYGKPGTAKSDLIRTFAEAVDRSYWDTTISAFTSLDELFGPFDLIRMRDMGVYERRTMGMLTHEMLFLDEIGNSSSAVRDAIKTAINERLYRNGDISMDLPMQTLVAASNSQLLDVNSTEEAFADRFLIRAQAHFLEKPENVVRMLKLRYGRPLVSRMDGAVIGRLQSLVRQVEMTDDFLMQAESLRRSIKSDGAAGALEITDRRMFQTMDIVAAHAILNGRMKARRSDLVVFGWTFWSNPEDEELPLQEWLKLNIRSNIPMLEGMRENGETTMRAWREQVNADPAFRMAENELVASTLKDQATIKGIAMMLNMSRPKLEDQDEVDYANALEKDLNAWDKTLLAHALGVSEKSADAERTLIEELKKG